MTATPMNIPLRQLEANTVALRDVDLEDENVQRMFDSIARHGVLNAIRVTPALGPDGKSPKTLPDGQLIYRIVDGLHRFTGALKANKDPMPCLVETVEDAKLEIQQLEANLHRIPTKPAEYGAHLKRIIGRDQTRTLPELANELSVSVDFLNKRLMLNALHKDGKNEKGEETSSIGKYVDQGKITVSNAVELAKLKPSEEQLKFVEDAMTMQPIEFAQKIKSRRTELEKARREARVADEAVGFVATSHLRKKVEIEGEIAAPTFMPVLIKAAGITDPIQAALFALKWAMQLDEQSVSEARGKFEAREKERLANQAAAKVERAEKAAAEAKAAQAKATAAAVA